MTPGTQHFSLPIRALPPTESHAHPHLPRHVPASSDTLHPPAGRPGCTHEGFWNIWTGFPIVRSSLLGLRVLSPSYRSNGAHSGANQTGTDTSQSPLCSGRQDEVRRPERKPPLGRHRFPEAQLLDKILELTLFSQIHQFRLKMKYFKCLDAYPIKALRLLPQDSRGGRALFQFPWQDNGKINTKRHWYRRKLNWLKFFLFFMTVDIQYYASFRCAASCLDVYMTYDVFPPIILVPTWHQLCSLCCTLHPVAFKGTLLRQQASSPQSQNG